MFLITHRHRKYYYYSPLRPCLLHCFLHYWSSCCCCGILLCHKEEKGTTKSGRVYQPSTEWECWCEWECCIHLCAALKMEIYNYSVKYLVTMNCSFVTLYWNNVCIILFCIFSANATSTIVLTKISNVLNINFLLLVTFSVHSWVNYEAVRNELFLLLHLNDQNMSAWALPSISEVSSLRWLIISYVNHTCIFYEETRNMILAAKLLMGSGLDGQK